MNWLTLAVIIFILIMTIDGARKGLVRMTFSLASMVLALVIVSVLHTPLENFLREYTQIPVQIENAIGSYVSAHVTQAAGTAENQISALGLPEFITSMLLNGNTQENWVASGAANLSQYLTVTLSTLAFSAFVYVLGYVLARVAIWILSMVLGILSRLPVIRQVNALSGGVVGFIVALMLLWVGELVVTAGAGQPWGQTALAMIEESALLQMISNSNILMRYLVGSTLTGSAAGL